MIRNSVITLLTAFCGSSLLWMSAHAGHRDRKFQLLSPSTTFQLPVVDRKYDTWHMNESWLIRGGSQSESSVSVSADETLPAEIAGASLMAFRANVPVSDTTHKIHTNQAEDVEQVVKISENETVQAPATPSLLAERLANLRQRSLPAILMLAAVGAIAKFLKEDGLIGLTLLFQVGMYQETTRVIGGDFPHPFYKWWWFITASLAINAPRVFSWANKEIAVGATAMAIFGILSSIIRFNYRQADVEEFRDFLRQAAVSFMATILVVLPSSYWIATLEEFGMKWVAMPAALVIINDTMAYFFGIAFGRNKILPVISPGKTWEGFLGATASTIVAAYFGLESKQDAVVLALAVSLVGPFGGFLASLIKRAYAQKDFGSLFPGHGGFVDRLDCQLILAPIIYLYLALGKKK